MIQISVIFALSLHLNAACLRTRLWHRGAMNFPAYYHSFITWIGDGTGLPDTLLHIHAGMAILLIVRVVSGRSLGTSIPLSVVAAAEFFNEVMDRLLFGSWRPQDTLSDIGNTLFWPTVICLAVRIRPLVMQRRLLAEARAEAV